MMRSSFKMKLEEGEGSQNCIYSNAQSELNSYPVEIVYSSADQQQSSQFESESTSPSPSNFYNDNIECPRNDNSSFRGNFRPTSHNQQQQLQYDFTLNQQQQTQIEEVPASMQYLNNSTQQQILASNYSSQNCSIDQGFGGGTSGSANCSNFPHNFPSMSVNVSMNMTMGYIPESSVIQHPGQCQWHYGPQGGGNQICSNNFAAQTPQNSSYSTTTYSFATDFRENGFDGMRHQWIQPPPPSSSPSVNISNNNCLPSSNHHRSSIIVARRQKAIRSTEFLNRKAAANCFGGSKLNLCRICGKSYARPSTLKTHLRTHSGEKPYSCLQCHKSFSQAANLTAHIRTHSGEKPFCCLICNRKFSQSSSVTTHMRTHSGERPYRCRYCKKAFSDSSTLTKHFRIHSGEKPYQCKLCLLRFSQSGNLNRHMRVHSANLV